jgi:Tol biopolymer transport system component
MSIGISRSISIAALGLLILSGCEGKVNDDENFFVLTFRASLDSGGQQATGPSDTARFTPDGRFIVFTSRAPNLVPGDNLGRIDVFRKDLATGEIVRVSVQDPNNPDPDQEPDENCINPVVSSNGRFVAFESESADLTPNDFNNLTDVFVRDIVAGTTVRASEAFGGGDASDPCSSPSISDDGRYVAFQSVASNLVPSDFNGDSDVFVRDTLFNTTIRVSTDASGAEGSGDSQNGVISGDGLQVAFDSDAALVPTDDFGFRDVYVKSWLAPSPVVTRVSLEATGDPDEDSDLDDTDGNSFNPSISQDGRFIAYISNASDLVIGDNNLQEDVFVRDVVLGITKRVSTSSQGGESSAPSFGPQISRDGRWVVFFSQAPDLVPSDTNNAQDIFLRDTVVGTTDRISVATYGIESSAFFDSVRPSISGDGRFVCFTSLAPNLAPNDTNGTSDIYVRGPLY